MLQYHPCWGIIVHVVQAWYSNRIDWVSGSGLGSSNQGIWLVDHKKLVIRRPIKKKKWSKVKKKCLKSFTTTKYFLFCFNSMQWVLTIWHCIFGTRTQCFMLLYKWGPEFWPALPRIRSVLEKWQVVFLCMDHSCSRTQPHTDQPHCAQVKLNNQYKMRLN